MAATPATTRSSSAHTFTTYLYAGSSGSEVKILQDFLVAQGFLSIANTTTYYGPLTTAAVKAFQKANGIEQTGGTGPLTRAAINSKIAMMQPIVPTTASSTPPTANTVQSFLTKPLVIGMTDPQVTVLQRFLVDGGYLSVTPTGYFGPLTRAAVMRFQAANGIDQIGSVGPMTRAAINARFR